MKKRILRTIGKEEGFTIIEVVLVLAIAGLIFLVVFLALPQLQRSRRDTQRRNDAGRVLAALESYASNHNGAYPAANANNDDASFGNYNAANSFWGQYIITGSSDMQDPSEGNYTITFNGNGFNGDPGQMDYSTTDNCSATVTNPASARDIAVRVGLEEGTYCQDNK